MSVIFFLFFLLVYISLCFLLTKNTIYATLLLISVYIVVAVLLMHLNVPYLGIIFLMVYVGAISILFLFVVMMLPLKTLENEHSIYFTFGVFFFLLFLFLFSYAGEPFFFVLNLVLSFDYFFISFGWLFVHVYSFNVLFFFEKLGFLIFNVFFLYLLVVGCVLLIAMVGAIFLTNEHTSVTIKRQQLQLTRVHLFYYTDYLI